VKHTKRRNGGGGKKSLARRRGDRRKDTRGGYERRLDAETCGVSAHENDGLRSIPAQIQQGWQATVAMPPSRRRFKREHAVSAGGQTHEGRNRREAVETQVKPTSAQSSVG